MNYTAATYSNITPVVFYGGGFCGGVDPRREQYAGEDVAGVEVPDYKTKYEALQNVIKDNYQLFEVDYYGVDNDNYVDGEGFCCEPKAQAKNARSLPTENVDYEKLQYYYHPDHLGSASYITNLDGEVVQHIEYVPFGEVFLEGRNNTWNTPFLFNGKELDEETGLCYYGARYYNPRISLWYGVDPLAEKHPDKTPYHYCSNNPIMRIDPDGLTDFIVNKETGRITQVGDPNNERDRILKTNGNGEIKRYTRGEREGQAKVAIDDISTGILEDGLNLKENNGSFNVNGEEQLSLEDFNWFISKFSDYIGKEITGIRLGDEDSDEVREVLTYQYRGSTRTTSGTPRSWLTRHGSRLKGHFHTQPYGDHTPSEDYDMVLRTNFPNVNLYIIAGGYESSY